MVKSIELKSLLTHAAKGRRSCGASADGGRAEAGAGVGVGASCLRDAVIELSVGNYVEALKLINKNLQLSNGDHDEVLGLLELKNIVVRLRLRCELPEQLIGPTSKSTALPYAFSVEMLDVVQKVLRCRSHYEVLRISHHATYSEVKRAYKRLALRLHPDKNRAPGSEEAFRRINEAADTLTDKQKRIEYNLLTAVGDCFGQQKTSLYDHAKDEEFDFLAGDGDGLKEGRRHSYQPANQRIPQRQTLYQTEQLVIGLVAALVFISITLHYLAAGPNYSFTPSSTHNVRLVSRASGVPFYVTAQFAAKESSDQRDRMEAEVEEVYLMNLKQSCKQERKMRDKLLQRAALTNNHKLRAHAQHMPTPACQTLASRATHQIL